MGAWGVKAFDNDAACDWSYDLEATSDLSLVRDALTSVLEVGSEYLDSEEACQGLAACEVIARLKGNWGVRNPYTETVDVWVAAHPAQPSAELVAQARAVVDRVLSPPSELLEVWSESDKEDWLAAMADLRTRLGE